jgi:hypothetical protein
MTENLHLDNHALVEGAGDQPCLGCDPDSGPPWGSGGSVVSSRVTTKIAFHFGDNLDVLRAMHAETADLSGPTLQFERQLQRPIWHQARRGLKRRSDTEAARRHADREDVPD